MTYTDLITNDWTIITANLSDRNIMQGIDRLNSLLGHSGRGLVTCQEIWLNRALVPHPERVGIMRNLYGIPFYIMEGPYEVAFLSDPETKCAYIPGGASPVETESLAQAVTYEYATTSPLVIIKHEWPFVYKDKICQIFDVRDRSDYLEPAATVAQQIAELEKTEYQFEKITEERVAVFKP